MSWKPSPKLRPAVWDALVVLLIIALAAVCAFLTWTNGNSAGELTAIVTIDGQEVDRFAPADLLEGPRTYTGGGYTMEVAYGLRGEAPALDHQSPSGEQGVCVALSDCPTQDCVHTGTISRSGQSIVCLPAKFILRLEGGTPAENAVDAILG